MGVSDDIKRHYIKPPIVIEESEWHKYRDAKLRSVFKVEQFIWLDVKLPEYRIAIPEELSEWADDEYAYRSAHNAGIVDNVAFRTRFITYRPTGKIVYDNSLPPAKAIVFEYELYHPEGGLV